MATVKEWLHRLYKWLEQCFHKKTTKAPSHRILRSEVSDHVMLRQIEPDYEDELSVRVRYWRCIFRSQERPYDLLLFCDRLRRNSSDRRRGDLTRLSTTHRFTIVRISNFVIDGKRRTDLLLLADLDCVSGSEMFRGLDGCALPIADSLAIQLKKRQGWDLDMLSKFEDSHGDEIDKERWAVTERWRACLLYYHSEYCNKTFILK